MNSKKNIIKQSLISVALITVFSVAIFFLHADVKNKTLKLVKVQQEVNAKTAAIGSLASLQSDAEMVKKYLPQMADYLINKDQLLNFQKDINIIAQQNNLNFSVGFGQETPLAFDVPRATSISLTSQTGSNMDNLIKFFSLLENSRYFVRFDNLDISQDGAQLKTNLKGQVYSF